MKKLFIFLLAAVAISLAAGCTKEYDDSALNNRINSLEQRLSALETVMQAYQNNLYIKSVQHTDNMYIITFSDGSTATISNGKDGIDGKDGADGRDGKDGIDGKDGDTLISYIVVGENEVTFVLTDGRKFSIAIYSALSIEFDETDLIVMSPNSTRKIHYTVKSIIQDVEIETVSSADIKAKVVATSKTEGAIEINTGAAIDEYSKVVVLVSNGEKVIMRRLTFEEAGLQVEDNATKNASSEGGEMALEFMSNVECEVVIPEDAKSWISVVPDTRAMERQTITLKLEPNTGHNRSATVTIKSPDGTLNLEYRVEQEGELGVDIDPDAIPDNEIWYVMSDNSVYDIYQTTQSYGIQPFDRPVLSNTYQNGYGIIKFDGPVKKINNFTFGNRWAVNMTALYLPDCIEYIGTGAISFTGLTTFRVPANLKAVGSYGLNNQNMTLFTGSHVSDDGKCVIINGGLYAFAPNGIKEYTVPEGVKIIDVYAFTWCDIENITFNEDLEYIGEDAFAECKRLKSLTFPSSLQNIHSYAFRGCTSIEGFYGNENFHTSDNKCLIFKQDIPGWNGPWICGFAGHGLSEYTIPEGIIGIENYVFQDKTDLKSITLPNSLVEVGRSAFYGCSNLETVLGSYTSEDHRCIVFDKQLRLLAARKNLPSSYRVPDGITSIGFGAFEACPEISEITMEDQVETIAGYAFAECPQLKSITLSARLRNISGYNAFLGSRNLETIYMRAPIPPAYSDDQMEDFPKLTIYVPQQSLDLYMTSPDWKLWRQYFKGYDYGDLSEFEPNYYISTDYSQDGKVTTIRTATEGKGIDIVLMGDAFSDRQIADGTYMKAMQAMADNLFTVEPYKSFKDMFNVYAVNVVSATEGYDYGNTALRGFFGGGTQVGGDDNACFEYALKAISEDRMDEALIVVAMNEDAYAGTCYMYYPSYVNGTYGSGPSVAYFPTSSDAETFTGLIHHEALGHGFPKLADEYAYEDMGTIPGDYAAQTMTQQNDWGWWKNVDFTNDPATIRWNCFLNDSRYGNESLGAYEGGLTYWSGVWRPTENSIMRYNTGGFNAPSREAIYYRIHKLAYGDSWEYNYEDFVKYDEINRKGAAAARAQAYRPSNYKPTHPPVIVNKSWRDAK